MSPPETRIPPRGVEFSDCIIVLHPPAPKPRPLSPRSDDDAVETSCTDSDSEPDPNPDPHSSHLEAQTYCIPPRLSQSSFERSTRINTKLNSLPSGGAFSLMNSSEDVNSSSSDEEDLRASRKMIRVDGSAKLSTASGLGDESDNSEDDEFGIEGAERVDEEEAVHVRSFGRSFAHVRLNDVVANHHDEAYSIHSSDHGRPEVSFNLPHNDHSSVRSVGVQDHDGNPSCSPSFDNAQGSPVCEILHESKSVPPKKKSKLKLTFVRRASMVRSRRSKEKSFSKTGTDMVVAEPELNAFSGVSCFPTRRTTVMKPRIKSSDAPRASLPSCGPCVGDTSVAEEGNSQMGLSEHATQLMVVPDMEVRAGRGNGRATIVKNVSMQRDDWIDFATNGSQKQRPPWLTRLTSHNRAESTCSSKRGNAARAQSSGSSTSRTSTARRLWKMWVRRH